MEIPKNPKKKFFYNCEKCNFNSSHKNDYNKHLITLKHQNTCFGNEMEINGNKTTQKNPIYLYVKIVIKNTILIQDYGNIKKIVA